MDEKKNEFLEEAQESQEIIGTAESVTEEATREDAAIEEAAEESTEAEVDIKSDDEEVSTEETPVKSTDEQVAKEAIEETPVAVNEETQNPEDIDNIEPLHAEETANDEPAIAENVESPVEPVEEFTIDNTPKSEANVDKNKSTAITSKKPIPKMAIIIGTVVASIAIVLLLILVVFKHEHTWSQWEIITEATCTAEGSKIRYCIGKNCDESERATIPAKGHSFGQWTTTKEKTCTENGIKERTCSCGEKETETIYSSGHNFAAWGICLDCSYGWVNINLPEMPLTVYSSLADFEFSAMRYELGRYDSGYIVRIFYSGTQIDSYQNNTHNALFYYKLVDSEGYTVHSGYTKTPSLNIGDKVKDESFDIKYIDLDPNETYTLIITSND